MNTSIVGRKTEQNLFTDALKSQKAEFIAVYGRRRVGKTYLIEEFFKKETCFFFQMTGLHKGTLKEQLTLFAKTMSETFFAETGITVTTPANWMDALDSLTNTLDKFVTHKKIVLFFDELPWLASKKSGFKKALDHYWNTKWSKNKKIILIICGSAASWIIKNIINDKGGLHNRVTLQIPLYPFSLKETADYLNHMGVKFNNDQILELYMTLGGVPHYLEKIKPNLSATQNISKLCFTRNGQLFNEFNKLFLSLFDHANAYIELVKIIAGKRYGIVRNSIENKAKLSTTGGTLTERLTALEQAGFIKSFIPIGYKDKGLYYKLIDEFCLFYLTWIEPVKKQIENETQSSYWPSKVNTPSWRSWSGYAFEAVCLKHITQIKKALFIPDNALSGSWQHYSNKSSQQDGAQIDLLFDRDDGVVTLCEIKYCQHSFEINKEYAANLQKKRRVFEEYSKIKKQVFLSMVTSAPLKKNSYSEEMITSRATLVDLMK